MAFSNPPVFVYTPTLQAFVDLWQTTYFYLYLGNTLIVAVITTIVGLADRPALRRTPCPATAGCVHRPAGDLALIFRALPRFAVVLPMYEISKAFGIYDTTYAMAIALVAINQPFSIWLLRNFFAEIPRSLDEAAMIDGCTRISVLRKVMIPLMGPGILTAGIFVFLFAFQEYLTAAILTDTAQQDRAGVHRHPDRSDPADAAAGRRGRHAAHPAGDRDRLHRPEVPGRRAGLGGRQGLIAQPLVLLPGLNCSPALWSRLDVGRAITPILTEATLDGQVERLLDELPAQFALAGLSLGGIVAMALVRRAPERVSRLCLMSTTSRPPTSQQHAMWARQRAALAAGTSARDLQREIKAALLSPHARASQPHLSEVALAMADDIGTENLDAQLALQATRIDERPGLERIRVPTLIISGSDDALCRPERHLEMHGLIAGSELVELDRCGHLSTLEQPAAVSAGLRRWLVREPATAELR